jgi:hypothetical protein
VIEYTSPQVCVSASAFKKVYVYICLYSSPHKAPLKDITFVGDHYPGKLFGRLNGEAFNRIEEKWTATYRIERYKWKVWL